MRKLADAVNSRSKEALSPDGKEYRSISLAAVREIARKFSCPLREVEIAALKRGIIPERYQRNLGTTGGAEGQVRLLKSRAAVVGLGGLGGLASELLARMGVGTLVLIDGDSFSESNLNRQLLSTEENLQQKKTEAAAARIKQVNSAVELITFNEIATEENIDGMIEGSDVVLDCLDNLKSRFLLETSCNRLGIPLVHAAIAQYLGQLCTIFPGDPGLKAIYGPFEEKRNKGIEKELGNPPATPALVASWQVQEAVKILLNRGNLLRRRLLFIDTEQGICEILEMEAPG